VITAHEGDATAARCGAEAGATDNEWNRYLLDDYSFVDFKPGALVLDVGCGAGVELRELDQRGCRVIGLDVDWSCLKNCHAQALTVLQGAAERMPFKDAVLDGLVCKVVISYTDEAQLLSEIGRLLKSHGVGYVCSHGAGYYLRYLFVAPVWKRRAYGLRTLVNTWCYLTTGRRLPGFLGDTLYQSRRRLARYYAKYDLRLVRDSGAATFLGLPVFIYHAVEKMTERRAQEKS
jgi:SAM-dependent methyltransferase